LIFSKTISASAIATIVLSVSATAQANDAIVSEFEQNCFSETLMLGSWTPVSSDFDASLDTYYKNIENLLGDQITSSSHFAKFINDRAVFLTRYSYAGHYGLSSDVCMISDFSRDSWELPKGIEALLKGKVEETEFAVTKIEGEKTVGHWRATESFTPATSITASAFPKNGAHHIDSQFYGLQLTATKLEVTEAEDNLN